MTYNKTKNNSIIAINVFIIVSIIIMSLFCLYSQNVYADTITSEIKITTNNIFVPVALTENTSNYPLFVNAYANISFTIDYSTNAVYLNSGNVISIGNITKNVVSSDSLSGWSPYENYYKEYDKTKIINISDITTNESSIKLYRISIDNAISIVFSIYKNNDLIDVNRVVIDNFSKEYLNTNDSIVGTSFTYYDSDNNYIKIIPLYAYYSPLSKFPDTTQTYAINWDNINNYFPTIFPLKYENRTYYYTKLTENQINQESFNIGYENGYNNGEIDGYNNGYNVGYDVGNNNGYENGYKNGIATKGESVWVNSMGFIKNLFVDVFDIFSIEILPNVSIGTFIVIPLIFGVLFFIVKITKGD